MPKIFISYRRADSATITGRIYDRLVSAFGETNVFKDSYGIQIGEDFRGKIREQIATCDVVLIIIGPVWLNITETGDPNQRRLDNPGDWVRVEVETALQRDKVMAIPILVGNASMPRPDDLPVSLRELAFKSAAVVRDNPDFNRDVSRIIRFLDGLQVSSGLQTATFDAPQIIKTSPKPLAEELDSIKFIPKLFISYRSLDSAKVDALVARLKTQKQPDGTPRYQLWQDKTSIPAGQDWWKAIVQAIIKCDIFVFMISSESAQNVNCRAELSYARKRNRPIIPLVLEGEFVYNAVTAKNDITFWEHLPLELTNGRFQFMFYEGGSFVNQLDQAINRLQSLGLRDIPAPEPPDPRHANDATNDISLIYDQACDYAGRLEFATAEQLFQRLIDWHDPLFANDAYEWIVLLRSYEQMVRLDEKPNTRYQINRLWPNYIKQFPKPFTPLFDPKDLRSRYGGGVNSSPQESEIKIPSRPGTTILSSAPKSLVKPRSFDFLPAPFAWIDIPGTIGKNWRGEPYKIAKYPVTNAQFRLFIEAGGYSERQWWTDAGWEAKTKGWDRKDTNWVETNLPWTQPRHWTNAKFNIDEQPVVGVSWYEAVAFCLWLSDMTGEKIMLPTEDQWQYAAQGDDRRVYPWGNEWDRSNCNNNVSSGGMFSFLQQKEVPGQGQQTTPVIAYQGRGDSPFGVVDMAGNVWEWCLTDYEQRTNEFNTISNRRVLRGGSWYFSLTNLFGCAYRDGNNPHDWSYDWGFRLARLD
ncbi:MAG TPA: SUMF1/EgtB/PvdO family nonheme iron enzyme [Phototrophicaceae bacterium]|nr:SUMF1/EgtB/PvdO family nonheme iron enzyme [Phototrophicaceae bacterium]